jgi:protein ERP2
MSSSVTATVALLCCLSLLTSSVAGVELTFELPDNAKECFHEHIPKDKSSTFEL